MYTPHSNAENRLPVLLQMMADHPLAAVVTLCDTGLVASHIPMVHEADGSEFGMLKGHVARANSQWKHVSASVDAMAIFTGHEHYISAGWYPGKHEDGKEVPTWNYITVHASGPLRVVHDDMWMLRHLESLTNTHEESFPTPWRVSDAPAEWVADQMKGIVGFEMPIRKLEGKWKLSQNRDGRDRRAVVEGLGKLGTMKADIMKALVEQAETGN